MIDWQRVPIGVSHRRANGAPDRFIGRLRHGSREPNAPPGPRSVARKLAFLLDRERHPVFGDHLRWPGVDDSPYDPGLAVSPFLEANAAPTVVPIVITDGP